LLADTQALLQGSALSLCRNLLIPEDSISFSYCSPSRAYLKNIFTGITIGFGKRAPIPGYFITFRIERSIIRHRLIFCGERVFIVTQMIM